MLAQLLFGCLRGVCAEVADSKQGISSEQCVWAIELLLHGLNDVFDGRIVVGLEAKGPLELCVHLLCLGVGELGGLSLEFGECDGRGLLDQRSAHKSAFPAVDEHGGEEPAECARGMGAQWVGACFEVCFEDGQGDVEVGDAISRKGIYGGLSPWERACLAQFDKGGQDAFGVDGQMLFAHFLVEW